MAPVPRGGRTPPENRLRWGDRQPSHSAIGDRERSQPCGLSCQPQVWCGHPVPPRRGPHWGLLRRGPLSRGLGLEELKSPGPQGPGAGGQSGCGATWPSPSEWLSGGRSQRGGRSAVWALTGPLCLLRALRAFALGPWVGGPLGPPTPAASAVLGERPGVEQAPWACDSR